MFKTIGKKIKAMTEYAQNKVNEGIEKGLKEYFDPNSSDVDRSKAKGVLMASSYKYDVDYLGGHYDEIDGKESVKIILLPDGIMTSFLSSAEYIPYNNIKTLELKTQEQIEKDVTLPRAIAFGWYALALQKKKKVVTQYLVINCEVNGMAYSMVFGGEDVSRLYSELFKKKMAG